MSYRLLDPLHRSREFRLFEERDPLHRDRVFWVTESDFAKDLVRGGDAQSFMGKMLGWNKETKFIDRIQDTADLVGVVDPTGVVDGANAVVYAMRGNFKDAATSALGMIPYLGDLAKARKLGRGAKLTGKAAKIEKEATKIGAMRNKAARAHFGRSLEVGVKRKLGRHGRSLGKALGGGGKLRGKAAQFNQKLQDFRQTGAGQKIEKGLRDRLSGAGGGGQPQQAGGAPGQPQAGAQQGAAPGGSFVDKAKAAARQAASVAGSHADPQGQHGAPKAPGGGSSFLDKAAASIGKAAAAAGTAAAAHATAKSGGGGGARPARPATPNARPDGGPAAKSAPKPQAPKRPAPAPAPAPKPSGGGGSSTGPRGATIVPMDSQCPTPKTKSSTDRAGGGKRCNKQTIPRAH